ncbi:heavy-metal-associated domain-containing protein [Streptococcus uberis]|uniref:heavy-metal-associated domain-containing protein n=1 Tax=Streptococcus uberis TaxID=1349 RepID=UPI0022B8E0EF|nr:heavy-metal-associated domain-containing protein [Streptococcus uberis]MCZ8466533.1 heavy-metal-associated domain-containing protein [Streptococcus uberis]
MKKGILKLEELACPTCMQKIEAAVKGVKGVDAQSVKVLFNASKVKVDFDERSTTLSAIARAIETIGYSVLSQVEKKG